MSIVKKKLKRWLIGLLLPMLPWLLAIIIVASGIGAIASFFKNLFSWGEKNNIDINNCTIEELIDAVDDKDIFTDKVLEEMMIDRKSFKRLLNGVYEYNNRNEEAMISVEVSVTYTVEEEIEVEESESEDEVSDNVTDESLNNQSAGGKVDSDNDSSGAESDEEKEPKKETVQVTYNEVREMDVLVSNNHIIRNYILDWQTLYIISIFKSMSNYKNWVPGETIIDDDGNEVTVEAVKLNYFDVDNIVDDFEHNYVYLYNAVEGPTSYTMDEVLSVPHDEFSAIEEKDGITYYISGYIPKSEISMVIAPYYIDMYSSGIISTYSLENTFINKVNKYYNKFTLTHFYALMENLPGGKPVAENYRYIFNLAKWSD